MAAAFHAMEQNRLASNESSTLDLTAMLLDKQVPLTISKNESGFKIQFEDKEMNLKGIVYSSFSSYYRFLRHILTTSSPYQKKNPNYEKFVLLVRNLFNIIYFS